MKIEKLFLVILMLCYASFSISAKSNIDLNDSETWGKEVIYVECKYIESVIEGKHNDGKCTKEEYQMYSEKIKPSFDNVYAGKEKITHKTIEGLLRDNSWGQTASALCDHFKSLLEKQSGTKDEILSYGEIKEDYTKYMATVKGELTKRYQEEKTDVSVKNDIHQKQQPKTEVKKVEDNNPPQKNGTPFWLIIVFVVLVCAILFVFYWNLNRRISELESNLEKKNKYSSEYNHKCESAAKNSQSDIAILNREIQDLKEKIKTLEIKIRRIDEVPKKENCSTNIGIHPNNFQPSVLPNVQKQFVYLGLPSNQGILEECDQQQACFKLIKNSNSTSGEFEFCGDEKRTLCQYEMVFDYACDYDGNITNPSRIIQKEKGKAESNGNGQWKVVSKGKVVFE